MNLRELLGREDVPSCELDALYEHTSEVIPGGAFLAIGPDPEACRKHAEFARDAGAKVVLVEAGREIDVDGIDVVAVADLADRRGTLAATFYREPSATLDCIGVTGTNGKTSVAHHIASLSDALGEKCGYSGTLGWGFVDELAEADLTTTNPVGMQRRLADMRDAGASRVALEVSSHALSQRRVDAVGFRTALFTNLTQDHLDYHGSMEEYGAAKARLFTEFSIESAVISLQTPFGLELAQRCPAEVITYGEGGDVTWRCVNAADGLEVEWSTPWGSVESKLAVAAEFAVANVTGALITLLARGADKEALAQAIGGLRSVPGRIEVVAQGAGSPTVVVDYAHTPDAVDHVLRAVRDFCSGELICVLGCGGDRDRSKRPLMAQAAVRHASSVWLTSDNPRSEDPEDIIEEMRSGLGDEFAYSCPDRREAICRAIHEAGPEDVVLIAGKGHEPYQEIDGVRHPFSDREVALKVLARIG